MPWRPKATCFAPWSRRDSPIVLMRRNGRLATTTQEIPKKIYKFKNGICKIHKYTQICTNTHDQEELIGELMRLNDRLATTPLNHVYLWVFHVYLWVFGCIWVYLWILQMWFVDCLWFFWISWVGEARRSFCYMKLGPLSSQSCVFVGIWVYLGVFVDFPNTICGFFVIFFYFLGRSIKTVILIYDTCGM